MKLIQKLSKVCSQKIISLGRLHEVNESVLRYGCELLLTSFFGLLILIGLSLLVGHPFAWVFFVIGFAPQRTSAGGYHADTHTRCYIATSAMFLAGILATYCFDWSRYVCIGIAVFSTISIIFLAPLTAVNKPLSKKRFRSNRIRSLIIAFVHLVTAVFFTMLNLVGEEINMYFAGIFFASASLIIGKIKNSLKGGKTDEG